MDDLKTPEHKALLWRLTLLHTLPEDRRVDFCAWCLGLAEAQLGHISRMTTGEAASIVQRLDAYWYDVAFVDLYERERVAQATTTVTGADLLR